MTKTEKQIANCRVMAVMDLNGIISFAETEIERIKSIRPVDSAEFADWVLGYTDRIHEICLDMKDLSTFGHRGGSAE